MLVMAQLILLLRFSSTHTHKCTYTTYSTHTHTHWDTQWQTHTHAIDQSEPRWQLQVSNRALHLICPRLKLDTLTHTHTLATVNSSSVVARVWHSCCPFRVQSGAQSKLRLRNTQKSSRGNKSCLVVVVATYAKAAKLHLPSTCAAAVACCTVNRKFVKRYEKRSRLQSVFESIQKLLSSTRVFLCKLQAKPEPATATVRPPPAPLHVPPPPSSPCPAASCLTVNKCK